jgi:branched-chain amino acid aminotransferase
MRRTLLNFLKENNYTVVEQKITKEELLAADEVFLTNSIYNIKWVQRINNSEYGNATTQKIYAAFLPTIS